MAFSLAYWSSPTLAAGFDWSNLIPLIVVAVVVIYQIIRGLSEAGRADSADQADAAGSESTLSSEERLRELAERRRQQLRELAERRRQAAGMSESSPQRGGEGSMQPPPIERRGSTASSSRDAARPVTPPRAPTRQREASQPWQRKENERLRERQAASDQEADDRSARSREVEAANRAREAAEAERERQQRLRRAAERSDRQKKSRSSARDVRSAGGLPGVRRPAPLVSSRHAITSGAIGTGQPTEAVDKKQIGHAAWVRKLRSADPRSLQRAIVLKEVLDAPVGLRQQQWSSPSAGDSPLP